jgi:hypothetical protein
MSTEAKVELLTAEVRTLMVGNRQVTLSVAKQLDRIGLEHLDPFGRIRIGDDGNLAIGRDRRSGALAISAFRDYFSDPTVDDLGDCRIRVCSGNRPNRNYYSLRYKDRSFRVHAIECDECNIAGHAYGNEKCPGWMMVGEDPEVGYLHLLLRFDEDDAHRARHRAAKDLPLIVLAGLR